jgi:hypothetical protein
VRKTVTISLALLAVVAGALLAACSSSSYSSPHALKHVATRQHKIGQHKDNPQARPTKEDPTPKPTDTVKAKPTHKATASDCPYIGKAAAALCSPAPPSGVCSGPGVLMGNTCVGNGTGTAGCVGEAGNNYPACLSITPSSTPSNSGTYKNGVPVQSCLNDPYTQGCPGGPNGNPTGSDNPTGCTTAADGTVSCSGDDN